MVGAGPTGLVLALWLKKRGVPVRLIDQNAGPGTASRAMAVQARTLEFYAQLGIADEVVAHGIPVEEICWRYGPRGHAALNLSKAGEGLGPYTFALSLPQDEHEKILSNKLRKLGLTIEWNTRLESFTQDENGVEAVLRCGDGPEICQAAYLCGCDGAHSAVRHGLDLDFPGGTYNQVFFVADVEGQAPGAEHALTVFLSRQSFVLVFPIRTSGMKRLIGILPRLRKPLEEVTFEDVRPLVTRTTRLKVSAVNWFSTYRVHHRVASHFQRGRVFLAGDAGHIHSPAGGQGMNTGIGDAVNLAWKLAAVLRDGASPRLLETYEPERIAFARTLVSSTDKAFRLIAGRSRICQLFRGWLPLAAPLALRIPPLRRAMFKLLSQIRIQYPQSPLSRGSAGRLSAGIRLPWISGAGNFKPLNGLNWQIHVFAAPEENLQRLAESHQLELHQLPWSDAARQAGFVANGLYLVRPDGYLAWMGQGRVRELQDYLEEWGIQAGVPASAAETTEAFI